MALKTALYKDRLLNNENFKISIVAIILAFIVFFAFLFQQKNEFQIQQQLPNIVFIEADDLGYSDLSYYGQEKFNIRHIRQLVEESLLFSEFNVESTHLEKVFELKHIMNQSGTLSKPLKFNNNEL